MIKEKLKRGSIFYKIYLHFSIFIRYKWFQRNRKSFSQFGEDIFINSFFKNQKIGKYVDLGAFHPMRLNNTYLLYKKGWSGTNIDLNQISIDMFNIARKNDKNICSLVSDKNDQKKKAYFEHEWSAVNSIELNEDLSKNLKYEKLMETKTFDKMIDEPFDFLNIDLEGHDYEVLKTIDLNKYSIKLICIEILESCTKKDKIYNYMKNSNFKFIKQCGVSYFFTNNLKNDC